MNPVCVPDQLTLLFFCSQQMFLMQLLNSTEKCKFKRMWPYYFLHCSLWNNLWYNLRYRCELEGIGHRLDWEIQTKKCKITKAVQGSNYTGQNEIAIHKSYSLSSFFFFYSCFWITRSTKQRSLNIEIRFVLYFYTLTSFQSIFLNSYKIISKGNSLKVFLKVVM